MQTQVTLITTKAELIALSKQLFIENNNQS